MSYPQQQPPVAQYGTPYAQDPYAHQQFAQQPYAPNQYGQPYTQPQQGFAHPSYVSPQPGYAAVQPPPYAQAAAYPPMGTPSYDAEYASAPMMAEGNYSSPQPQVQMHHQGAAHHPAAHHPAHPHPDAHAADAFVPGKQQLNYEGPNVVYRDLWALVLFVLHLVGMVILAAVHGPTLISDINSSPPDNQPPPATGEKKETSDNMFIALLVVAGVIGVAFSLFWLGVMKRYSSQIIKISLGASVLLAVLATIAAFAAGQVLMGVFYLIMAGLSLLYMYMVRHRIPFATAILQSAVQAIQDNGGPVWVVFGLSLLQIGWVALWAFIFVAVWHAGNKLHTDTLPDGTVVQTRADNSSGLQLLQTFCVFSLYWTAQVLKNIGHVTTAGVVASWWFQPSVTSPTRPALVRACTTSLGSICFASLLVALVETTRALLRQARRDACRDIADCLLELLERALKWFNAYALCTVAIYGDTFMESAKKTGQLFQAHLFTALINDDLSSAVLFCGAFLSGSVAGIVGLIWGAAKDAEGYIVMGILAFIVGFLVATLAMSVIRSAVTTTFVCWASDPATLNHNRPVEFGRIIDAGQTKYGGEGIQQYAGGHQMHA